MGAICHRPGLPRGARGDVIPSAPHPMSTRPAAPAVSLEPLEARDVDEAAEVLARAFRDNPGYLAVFGDGDPERRRRALVRVKRGFVRCALRFGVPWVARVDGRIAGVSLTLRPGQYPLPLRGELLVASGPLTCCPRAVVRFARLGAMLSKDHPHDPHHYLFVLGVDPPMQGRGVGGALLRHLNDEADRAGSECYLETDRESSMHMYRRFGYEVTRERHPKGLDVHFWMMTRPGRDDGSAG